MNRTNKRKKIEYHRLAYGTGIIGAILQIGAFIFHTRYDTCIYNRAKIFAMAHYWNKKSDDTNDLDIPSESASLSEIIEAIASKEASSATNYSLRNIDSTIRRRLWKEVYIILYRIQQNQHVLKIDQQALYAIFQHVRQMSNEKEFNFIHNKFVLQDASNVMNDALINSNLGLAKDLLKKITDLWHIVHGLSVETVYGTIDLLTNEYKNAMKIASGNDLNLSYKAIQWALIRQHRINSEEIPMIDKLRLRAMLFQIMSAGFFILSIGLFIVALENHDRKDI